MFYIIFTNLANMHQTILMDRNIYKYAKIYYSALRGDEKELAKGLKAAAGFIRRELANSLNLRITPELTFLPDSSIAYGAHIAAVLEKLEISPEEDDQQETDGTEE